MKEEEEEYREKGRRHTHAFPGPLPGPTSNQVLFVFLNTLVALICFNLMSVCSFHKKNYNLNSCGHSVTRNIPVDKPIESVAQAEQGKAAAMKEDENSTGDEDEGMEFQLAGKAFRRWKNHVPSFDEMHSEDLKRRPRYFG